MMGMRVVIVLQCLAVSAVLGQYPCTVIELHSCLQPLLQIIHVGPEPVMPIWTEAEMTEICKAYDHYNECWTPSQRNCSPQDKLTFSVIGGMYQYMCKEKLEEYLEIRECFTNERVIAQLISCNRTNELNVRRLNTYKKFMSQPKLQETACNYLNEFYNCIGDAVQVGCGTKATNWTVGMCKAVMNAMSDYLDCSLNITIISNEVEQITDPAMTNGSYLITGDDSVHTHTKLVVGILVPVLIIAVVAAVAFVVIRKRQQTTQRGAQPAQAAAAPAYSRV